MCYAQKVACQSATVGRGGLPYEYYFNLILKVSSDQLGFSFYLGRNS